MDLEEWEYLSDDGLADHLQEPDEKGSGKRLISVDPNCIIDMDYLEKITNTQKKAKTDPIEAPISPNPVTPELPEPSPTHDWVVKEVISVDTVSPPVFPRENEFADMKLDSPKSTYEGLTPEIELGKPRFEEKVEEFDDDEHKSGKGVFGCNETENLSDPDQKEAEDEGSDGGLNIWKMGTTGIGALCSFGFAIATVCVIALGSRHREKPQDQKLHLQFYTHDKRMKRVVHHAAKLNEAISVMRGGAPLSRAHVSIGGYFEGL